jgi:outer membrane usher protein
MVYLEGEDEEAGIVGNNGIAYLSGLDARANQNLTVVWGKGKAHQCQFVLPAAPETANNPDSWHKKQAVACH